MKAGHTEWDNFLQTGRIDDYLKYCQCRKHEMFAAATKGAQATNATDNQWNRPAGYQDRRG